VIRTRCVLQRVFNLVYLTSEVDGSITNELDNTNISISSFQFTGTTTKTLTIEQQDDSGAFLTNLTATFDDTGVGGGVSDRLVELGAKVTRVNFGGAPADKDKFTSTADELWFLFPIDEVSIPDDPKLMEELSGRQFSYDNKGRRKIESKDDLKEVLQDEHMSLQLSLYTQERECYSYEDMKALDETKETINKISNALETYNYSEMLKTLRAL